MYRYSADLSSTLKPQEASAALSATQPIFPSQTIRLPLDKCQSVDQLDILVPDGGPLLPPQQGKYRRRKTLVLDLDETLVHSSIVPPARFDFSFRVPIVYIILP